MVYTMLNKFRSSNFEDSLGDSAAHSDTQTDVHTRKRRAAEARSLEINFAKAFNLLS